MLIATGFGKMKFPVFFFFKGFDTTENIHHDPHLKTELWLNRTVSVRSGLRDSNLINILHEHYTFTQLAVIENL